MDALEALHGHEEQDRSERRESQARRIGACFGWQRASHVAFLHAIDSATAARRARPTLYRASGRNHGNCAVQRHRRGDRPLVPPDSPLELTASPGAPLAVFTFRPEGEWGRDGAGSSAGR